MISPNTAPGTRIICVDAAAHTKYIKKIVLCKVLAVDTGLHDGSIYTVKSIEIDQFYTCGFRVILCEESEPPKNCDPGYSLERFDYLVLPKCLTDLLNTTDEPVDDPTNKECMEG